MKNKIVNNATWIIGSRIAQAVLSFVISSLTARYLGPSNFGLVNYASSLTTFLVPVTQLGFNAILVQEFISKPEQEGKTLGSAIVLNLLSSLLCIAGIIAFVCIANRGETDTLIVCSLYSSLLIFRSIDMIQYWFQARYLSKYTSIAMIISYLVVSVYKATLLIRKAHIYWFAVSNALDYFIIAILLYVCYRKLNGQRFSFSIQTAKHLFNHGKYFAISGVMVIIFGQTDRIMLKLMIGDAATGFYAAASTLVGYVSFVFVAIIDSMRPAILEAKKESVDKYEHRVMQLYSIVIYLAIILSVGFTVFANLAIRIVYGNAYSESIGIMRILAWYTTFSYYGGAKDVWILAENKQKYLLELNSAGAIANIILNYILIPILGGRGAAIASLVTQIFTNIVMGFVIKSLRPNNKLLIESIKPKHIAESLRIILHR